MSLLLTSLLLLFVGRNRGKSVMQLYRLEGFYSSIQFAMKKKKGYMMTTLSVTILVYESQLLPRLYFPTCGTTLAAQGVKTLEIQR